MEVFNTSAAAADRALRHALEGAVPTTVGLLMIAAGVLMLWQRRRLTEATARSRIRSEGIMSPLVAPVGERTQRRVAAFSVPAGGVFLMVVGVLLILDVVHLSTD